ncbi:hypothetical protein [Streptococcus sp. oral taxon 056]|uniref:hypothetical protein n=1 Tax=Streptococcus sp. oral taxon 056 TaxID=712620 RepID=UPI0020D24266|nr:hypothetical protein [Streptococcus sp. oral taxon 056]
MDLYIRIVCPFFDFLVSVLSHFFSIYKKRKENRVSKNIFREIWDNMRQKGVIKSFLGMIIGLPIVFLVFPAYEGYRIVNGIWRYHYFTNQTTEVKNGILIDVDTYVGGRKSTYSRTTLTIITEGRKREVNISDSNKSLARSAKKHLKPPLFIEVHVNKQGNIVYLD